MRRAGTGRLSVVAGCQMILRLVPRPSPLGEVWMHQIGSCAPCPWCFYRHATAGFGTIPPYSTGPVQYRTVPVLVSPANICRRHRYCWAVLSDSVLCCRPAPASLIAASPATRSETSPSYCTVPYHTVLYTYGTDDTTSLIESHRVLFHRSWSS